MCPQAKIGPALNLTATIAASRGDAFDVRHA